MANPMRRSPDVFGRDPWTISTWCSDISPGASTTSAAVAALVRHWVRTGQLFRRAVIYGGGTLSSRLGNRVRQKEGLSYGAVSVFGADSKDKSGRFFMYAICNPENIDKVDKAVLEELDMILKDGVTAKELDEAKAAYLKQRHVRRAADGALASQLADGLENDRTFAYHADLEKQVAGLTVDQVNAALRKHWQPKKLVFVRAGDFKK